MMITDFESDASPKMYSADTVIIGAGAVGLSMFAEMTRNGEDVLLLEAGSASMDDRSQNIMRQATNTGHLLEGLHLGRYRYLGGTTNFWGGQLIEFDPLVFEARPWIDSKGWPIGKNSIQQYYTKAMSLIEMGGAISTDEAIWARSGTVPAQLGDEVEYFFTRWIKTTNFAKLFRKDIADRQSRLLVNANVVGFSKHSDTGRHTVNIKTFGGKSGLIEARKIVLACGTIETSRLLLQKYIDGSTPSWSANPWLGRAYLDHIDFNVGDVVPRDAQAFGDLFENMFFDGYKYNPKLKLAASSQKKNKLVGVAGAFIYSTSYKEHSENIKIFMRSLTSGRLPKNILQIPGHIFSLWKVAVPMAYRYLRSSRMFHPKDSRIFLRVTSEQIPLRDSQISLNSTVDALGVPTVNVHWAIDGRELDSIAYFAEEVHARLRAAGIADLAINPKLAARDRTFLTEGDDTNHQMGGCRMAETASDGVVDINCKVFGTDDIFVAGAAVIPSSGFPNCTLTSIALGLRLSDHLRSI